MSAIGKVFVVLNLVFSLVILGVLGGILSKSDEYKRLFEESENKYTTSESKWEEDRGSLNTRIQQYQREAVEKTERINALEQQNNVLTSQLASEQQDNAELRASVTALEGNYGKFTASLEELRNHNQQLVSRNEELTSERTEAVDARRAAEEDRMRLEARSNDLEALVKQLEAQIAELEGVKDDLTAQMRAAVQSGFDIAKVQAPPQIDGVVEHVNPGLNMVLLSVGSDDGVSPGVRFEIYDSSGYKGQVVVDDVFPDNASARITRAVGSITVNDKATTRL